MTTQLFVDLDAHGISSIDDVLHSEAQLLFSEVQTNVNGDPNLPHTTPLFSVEFPRTLSTTTDSVFLETDIRTSIKLREEYLARLRRHVVNASPTDLQQRLLEIIGVMDLLRTVTVDVVESIVRWRRGLPKPFPWKGSMGDSSSSTTMSYLIKISSDTNFLTKSKVLERWMGITLMHNPFFSLNYKCRQEDVEERKKEQLKNVASGGGDVLKVYTASRKLLLATMNEDRLQGAEDAIRREEIHNGMVLRGEIGGVPIVKENEKEKEKGVPEEDEERNRGERRRRNERRNESKRTIKYYGDDGIEIIDQEEEEASQQDEIAAASRLTPTEVLLADRVRRKLAVVRDRPKLRAKLLKIANSDEQQPLKSGTRRQNMRGAVGRKTMGRRGKYVAVNSGGLTLKQLRLLMVQHTGTKFDEPEWRWLKRRLDPHGSGRVWAEDLVSLMEIRPKSMLLYYDEKEGERKKQGERENGQEEEGGQEEEEGQEEEGREGKEKETKEISSRDAATKKENELLQRGEEAEYDFLPQVKRRRRKHTKRELEQIALLEEELRDLMEKSDKTEEELEWWRSQHEWQDATVRSVSARRTKLRQSEREIEKRTKEAKHLYSEIAERRRRLDALDERTMKSRKAIAEQQTLKALWFQYGGRKKYEEHLRWEEEKEALRQAMEEEKERRRRKKEIKERRRAEERERRERIRCLGCVEIQRCWRGRLGRERCQRRKKWMASKLEREKELERRRAVKIQSIVRGRRERRHVASRKTKKIAAVRLQSMLRGRRDRTTLIPKIKYERRREMLLSLASFRSNPTNAMYHLLLFNERVRRNVAVKKLQVGGKMIHDVCEVHGETVSIAARKWMDELHRSHAIKLVGSSELALKESKRNESHHLPHARQAIVLVSVHDEETSRSHDLTHGRDVRCMMSQLQRFCDGGGVPGSHGGSNFTGDSPMVVMKKYDVREIAEQTARGRSVVVPIKKVGLSALERTHFLLEVKAMMKEIHNRRVRLRREMLTKGRVGLFNNVDEIEDGGGSGPADLLQYVDPIIMLVCNEFDLGRVGRGQILPMVMVEEDEDEEEEEMPMIDTLKGRLVELARLLWSLPVNARKPVKEETARETGSPKRGSPKSGSPKSGSPKSGSPKSGSPKSGSPEKKSLEEISIQQDDPGKEENIETNTEYGMLLKFEEDVAVVLNIIDMYTNPSSSSVGGSGGADSGTKAPSMEETIRRDEYASELMVLETLSIILYGRVEFDGPWPGYPESAEKSQRTVYATLRKMELEKKLHRAKKSSVGGGGERRGRGGEGGTVYLRGLVSMLRDVNLFELARNGRSVRALRRYVDSGRWNEKKKREEERRVAAVAASSMTGASSTATSEKPTPRLLSPLFVMLREYVEQVSGFLDDLIDYESNSSAGVGVSKKIRDGGPPAEGATLEERSYLSDSNIPFDHVFVLCDTPAAGAASSSTVHTPSWYRVAADIFLTLVTGHLKERRELDRNHVRSTFRCLLRCPILEDGDKLGTSARRPRKTRGSGGSGGTTQGARDRYLPIHGASDGRTPSMLPPCLGIDVHRTVFQYDHGKFYSTIVLHVESLEQGWRRVLVLQEHGNNHSNHASTTSTANTTSRSRARATTSSDEHAGLLARLVAPHVSMSGNATHHEHYVSGRKISPLEGGHVPLSSVRAMLEALTKCACLTYHDLDGGSAAAAGGSADGIGGDVPPVRPALVLRREAVPVLRLDLRIPDLRAPSSIGLAAHCSVWEGASGELVIEAQFDNESAKGRSSTSPKRGETTTATMRGSAPIMGGVTRTMRTTWQSLRHLARLPFFSAGMRAAEREAIALGDMRNVARFVLRRMTYDGKLLRMSTYPHDKVIESLSSSTAGGSSSSASPRGGSGGSAMTTLTSAARELDVTGVSLVHPLLAAAEGVVLKEAEADDGGEKKGEQDAAAITGAASVPHQLQPREQRMVFVTVSRDNSDGSISDNRNSVTKHYWIHVLLLHPSKEFDTIATKHLLLPHNKTPSSSPSRTSPSRTSRISPSRISPSRTSPGKKRRTKITSSSSSSREQQPHWLSLKVTHSELARATPETAAALASTEALHSIFKSPFWSSEGPLSVHNAAQWMELYRVDDSESVRRVRASESHRSSLVMRAYPPNSCWGIRLKKAVAMAPRLPPMKRKRKDILVPTKDGLPQMIGITSKKMMPQKTGIRLFTQPRKIIVSNYLGRKKTKKAISCMITMYDESEGPPNPPTVMRLEVMHPESGEMVVLRLGPKLLKRAYTAREKTPNRFEIAEVLVNQLEMNEYIDSNVDDDLPPRMLTLCVKKVIKDEEEEKKVVVKVDEVQ